MLIYSVILECSCVQIEESQEEEPKPASPIDKQVDPDHSATLNEEIDAKKEG